MKRWQGILLGLIISAVTLAVAVKDVRFDQLGSEFARGRYAYVLPALAFIFLGLGLRAVRWRALLNGRIDLVHSFHILNVSYLFNTLLPLRLGEVVRAFLATRLQPPVPMFTSLSSVVVERLTDVLAVVIIIVLAILIAPVTPEIEMAARASGIAAIAGMIVLAVFAARRSLAHRLLDMVLQILPFLERFHVRRLADRVLDGIAPLGSARGATAAFFWTAVSWITSVIQTYLLIFVFYERPTWNAALLMTSIASLAIALPAAPGSIGPFEWAMITGLRVGGLINPADPQAETRAFACAVLIHIVSVGSYAFLGVIGLSQERISLGEVIRSARQMAVRPRTEAPAGTETVS
jgi:glycosyltransferase 2 family protein